MADSGISPELAKRYLRTEAWEIAGIAEREVARAMKPGNNIGFAPELDLVQIENSEFHIGQYPAHREESMAREPRDKRALSNWRVMHNARWGKKAD